jgi:NADPH-dependent 2,4-dienoyl-CoA reductase/sulfur reductase-like enzyme/rhodanese-related sulfurtransferase
MRTFIIIGGVAGGASAAARLRRLNEKARIIVIERGPYISFANCGLPYHISATIPKRDALLVTRAAAFSKRFNIDVRTGVTATAIDPAAKTIHIIDNASGEDEILDYDALILAPGARPQLPPVAGIDLPCIFSLRTMGDMDAIIAFIKENSPQKAVIAGGGFIGLEVAENLKQLGIDVAIVQRPAQVLKHLDIEIAAALHAHLRSNGIELHLGNALQEIHKTDTGLCVTLKNGEQLDCDMVVAGLGVRPEVDLAKNAGLEIADNGGIVVNDRLQTSDPCIYAVGDAIEVRHLVNGRRTLLPLAGPANRQGRLAADNICGADRAYGPVQGTEIIGLFGMAAARTGLAEKDLADGELPFATALIHPLSHAGYYPGARQMTLKLMFSTVDGRILGAQAVGFDGVDKRIDVLATAIRAGMAVDDLTRLELAYAPQFGSAKDPVNMVGFVAENILSGKVQTAAWHKIEELATTHHLLDVRTPPEFAAGTIADAVNITLNKLRARLADIPRKPLLVFCETGLRSYIACRILKQNGFECLNLNGGYKTYRLMGKNRTGPE